jgi:chromate transport protein ChrA
VTTESHPFGPGDVSRGDAFNERERRLCRGRAARRGDGHHRDLLPSLFFVALLARLVAWMRASATFGALLGGINAAAIGLMAGVSVQLAGDALVDPLTIVVAAAAGLALWRTSLNSAWLIAAGAATGLAQTLITRQPKG